MRYLVYIFPILINMMNGGMFFITAQRFAEAGASKMLITGTMVTWAFLYSIMSVIVGRFVTEARSAKMIFFAALMLMGTMLGAILLPSLNMQFVWLLCLGIAGAIYCTAFQVFMKYLENGQDGGIVRSTALYTAAWSTGLGLGPFIFGVMDWRISYGINAFFSLLIAIGILLIERVYCKNKAVAEKSVEAKPVQEVEPLYRDKPDLVMLGWIGGFLGTFTISILRTLEPARAVELGFSRFNSAMIIAVVSYTQAVLALLLLRGRLWMYSSKILVISSLCGIAGFLGFAYASKPIYMYISAILYGICSVCFYFKFVFHSLVHPVKSGVYISINEALVGISGTTAPLCAGFLAGAGLSISNIFVCCAAVVFVSMIIQIAMAKIKCRHD